MKLGYCLPFSAFKWFSGSVRGVRATEVQAQILRSGTLGVNARPDIDGSCRDFGLRRISQVSICAFIESPGKRLLQRSCLIPSGLLPLAREKPAVS